MNDVQARSGFCLDTDPGAYGAPAVPPTYEYSSQSSMNSDAGSEQGDASEREEDPGRNAQTNLNPPGVSDARSNSSGTSWQRRGLPFRTPDVDETDDEMTLLTLCVRQRAAQMDSDMDTRLVVAEIERQALEESRTRRMQSETLRLQRELEEDEERGRLEREEMDRQHALDQANVMERAYATSDVDPSEQAEDYVSG